MKSTHLARFLLSLLNCLYLNNIYAESIDYPNANFHKSEINEDLELCYELKEENNIQEIKKEVIIPLIILFSASLLCYLCNTKSSQESSICNGASIDDINPNRGKSLLTIITEKLNLQQVEVSSPHQQILIKKLSHHNRV